MTKAVFLDWFHTLARFEPPREKLHCQVLQEFGMKVSLQKVKSGLLLADEYWFDENIKSKVRARSSEEQAGIGLCYQQILLTEVGIEVSEEILLKIVKKVQDAGII